MIDTAYTYSYPDKVVSDPANLQISTKKSSEKSFHIFQRAQVT